MSKSNVSSHPSSIFLAQLPSCAQDSSNCGFPNHIQLDTPQSVRLLWTRDRPLYFTTHNTHNKQTTMPPAGLELLTPASNQPQTTALG
jgi:hypothetical protein